MLRIHLAPGYDRSLAPIHATALRPWWDDNRKTRQHAKHCHPLIIANTLGYYILSPGTFKVVWNGDTQSDVAIEHIERSSHYEVDNHAAFGSFCVQAKLIPVTEHPGEFVYIKGIPNERGAPYSCMEACIEAWWNMGFFGLVFLLNQPGEFMINKGQPLAHMFVLQGAVAGQSSELVDGYPAEHQAWLQRRMRKGYTKDLDYLQGRHADGTMEPTHMKSWAQAKRLFNK